MKPLLLDTNIIVDALRKRNDRHLLIEHLLNQGQPLASCPITITEIYAGMRPHEEKPTRAFMGSLLFLPITKEIAEAAGFLKAQYSKHGKGLSFQDASIAAVCPSPYQHHPRDREHQGLSDAGTTALSPALEVASTILVGTAKWPTEQNTRMLSGGNSAPPRE